MSRAVHRRRWETVYAFGEHWEKEGAFQWFNANIAIFPCRLIYSIRGKTRTVSTEAHLNHEGKLWIKPEHWLNSDDHYTEFRIEYQEFALTAEHHLRVEGMGPKLGDYWLEVAPTISN